MHKYTKIIGIINLNDDSFYRHSRVENEQSFRSRVEEMAAGGADIIELGVPFSDPFADGGVIRAAAYEALRQGLTLVMEEGRFVT